MISVAIVGGAGRMGQTTARAVHDADDLSLTALVDVTTPQESFGAITTASLEDLDATTIDVVIDFSTLERSEEHTSELQSH